MTGNTEMNDEHFIAHFPPQNVPLRHDIIQEQSFTVSVADGENPHPKQGFISLTALKQNN